MSYGYGNVGGSYDKSSNVGGAFDHRRNDNKMEFVLLVVLFILLIIVGAAFIKDDKHDY